MLLHTAVSAQEVTNTESLLIPAASARARDGLWLVEFKDGSFTLAFGDRLFARPVGRAVA